MVDCRLQEKIIRMRFTYCFAIVGSALTLGETARAAAIEVIHTTIAGHPSSVVPGTASLRFDRFDHPNRSPDGTKWILSCSTIRGAIEDDLILKGSGKTGVVMLSEGPAPSPWNAAETINTLDPYMGINNAGQFAFSANTSGGPDASDEYVIKWNGSNFEIFAHEADPVPAIAGATYGLIMEEVHILADGTVGFDCINVNNVPSNMNTMHFLGSAIVEREGVTVPAGQLLGGLNAWEFFDFGTYMHSDDGTRSLAVGDLAGNTNGDNVLVINNTVMIQEGQPLANGGFIQPVVNTASGFVEANMMSNGDWFARGSNSGGQDWVVRNNIPVVRTSTPIFTGATEQWSDAVPNVRGYNVHVGNNHGDYAIGGWTNNANLNLNQVIVLNNQQAIVREGDPVDLNGNGLADDDVFIAAINDDEAFLDDRPYLYFNAMLKNGAGTAIGEGFLRKPLCAAGVDGDVDGNCVVNIDDLVNVITSWGNCPTGTNPLCPTDFDHNGVIDIDDLVTLITHWG
jgi:hypothetical protein